MAHILLIDDEEAVRKVQYEMLRRAGHEVMTASNGQEALPLMQEHAFELVITDLIMPEKEGIETITLIRRQYPWIKIIAVSGGGRTDANELLKLAKILGANQTLSKPFTMQELVQAVDSVLGGGGE